VLFKREVLSQDPGAKMAAVARPRLNGQPEGLKQSDWSKEEKSEGNYHMFGDRTARNVGEISRELPHRRHWCSGSQGSKSQPEEVRAPVVAKKWVTTMEPGDAGK